MGWINPMKRRSIVNYFASMYSISINNFKNIPEELVNTYVVLNTPFNFHILGSPKLFNFLETKETLKIYFTICDFSKHGRNIGFD